MQNGFCNLSPMWQRYDGKIISLGMQAGKKYVCGFRHYELVDIGGNEIAATVDDLSQLTFIY